MGRVGKNFKWVGSDREKFKMSRVEVGQSPFKPDPFDRSSYNSFFILFYGPLGQPTHVYNYII